MSKRKKKYKLKKHTRYEFTHGRFGLAFLYGFAITGIVMVIIAIAVSEITFIYTLIERSVVFGIIIMMVPMFFPILYMIFLPPKKLNINVKCVGILHDDFVEIQKGKRTKIQRYEDIKFVYHFTFRISYWQIGKVRISDAVGVREEHMNSDTQLRNFANAVKGRVERAKKS